MKKSILITGGARSGKSALAERLVKQLGDRPVYIATAQAFDDEMTQRIAAHQARRGEEWHTISAPLDLVGALNESDGSQPRLVDCLTLWLTNLMLAERDVSGETADLLATLSKQLAPVVFVTNEVGSGIVPENRLAREFRDAAGALNQRVADACAEVYLAVSGQALKVKPNDNYF
ncbi:MAG: bifunctional adenosylcobinamide kinase/adenosylcobinamide-phosphate guanylyltransferase [Paracoccaceae bacterium]|jgi:adenosylcobinamide kinase/adenosylcobinamide-phosphate guanylyltransferase|nr:bifunctional adenosylcobinamide kinase/adenosylcobinamide-phosphate guanylyltransferase [Paracoccaceae bacterium]MDP7186935.1 bifunctional adenosylcobinamide kinase/adenosylcobinamide-phosphate guanylyltransferase [Paracoccaceae bacterium]